MWRSSVTAGIMALALAAATIVSLGADSASGQFTREPALEGVSYSEMAEWQGRYGGGPHPGYLRPGPPQAYGFYPSPPCGWTPPACTPKKKARNRRR